MVETIVFWLMITNGVNNPPVFVPEPFLYQADCEAASTRHHPAGGLSLCHPAREPVAVSLTQTARDEMRG